MYPASSRSIVGRSFQVGPDRSMTGRPVSDDGSPWVYAHRPAWSAWTSPVNLARGYTFQTPPPFPFCRNDCDCASRSPGTWCNSLTSMCESQLRPPG